MRLTLTVTAGPHEGQSFTFADHDTFLVGRSKRAHFQLPFKDKYFSRAHFLVEFNPPHCRLMDIRSRNGTYVNGARVTRADLRHGDVIKAGHTLLLVSLEEVAETPPDLEEALSLSRPPSAFPSARLFGTLMPSTPPTPSLPPMAQVVCPVCAGPVADVAALLCASCEASAREETQIIPGYRIVRRIGKGGMGLVHLAVDTRDGGVVALKTILPALGASETDVARFLREAQILRQLDHPHIVAFRDMGDANGMLYFAMDYVPGVDAAALVKKDGTLDVGRAVRLIDHLLAALEYAHARGFVHRDIKPANLLVTSDGEKEVVKLADFGLAKTYQASRMSGLTLTDNPGGTIAFMPPEQVTDFRGAKPTADQYSTAATLYHLLTGKLLFDFPPLQEAQFAMILHEEPVPLRIRRPDVPKDLAKAVHRALAKEPEKRFADATAMRQALAPFAR